MRWLAVLSLLATACGIGDVGYTGLEVSPDGATVKVGRQVAFSARYLAGDATSGKLTGATWASSDPRVATIDASGVATGVAPGVTAIEARTPEFQATVFLTVEPAAVTALTVTPPNSLLNEGESTQLLAMAYFDDGTALDVTALAAWQSANESIAAVELGRVEARDGGTTTVSATYEGVASNDVTIVVSLCHCTTQVVVSNPGDALVVGGTLQLSATAIFADGVNADVTAEADWASGDESIATVAGGLVTGVHEGTVRITATFEAVVGEIEITVEPRAVVAVNVSPPTLTLCVGNTSPLAATAIYNDGSSEDVTEQALWQASGDGVFVGQTGQAMGVSLGTAMVTAYFAGVLSAPAVVNVNCPDLTFDSLAIEGEDTLTLGSSLQLTARVTMSDFSTRDVTAQAVWTSSDESVVTVEGGLLVARAPGMATVTASFTGLQASATITVDCSAVQAITLAPSGPITLPVGDSLALTATGQLDGGAILDLAPCPDLLWLVFDSPVATVSDGLVSALAPGEAQVSAALTSTGLGADPVSVTVVP